MSNRSRNTVEIDTIAYYIATTGNDVEPGQEFVAEDSAECDSWVRWSFEATAEQIEQARGEADKWDQELAQWQGKMEQPVTLLTVEKGGHVPTLSIPVRLL